MSLNWPSTVKVNYTTDHKKVFIVLKGRGEEITTELDQVNAHELLAMLCEALAVKIDLPKARARIRK